MVSLRDKSHSPIEAPRIKLALMGLSPGLQSWSPSGARHVPNSRNPTAYAAEPLG
jgi:hypothetical protein